MNCGVVIQEIMVKNWSLNEQNLNLNILIIVEC